MGFARMILLLSVLLTGCVSASEIPVTSHEETHGMPIPPVQFISPDDEKKWEGEIEGRLVSYFRTKKEWGKTDVLVVIQDDLPEYFKRITYLDKGGDGTLDLVKMKVYEEARGWRDVGITKENKYGIEFAESKFKDLLTRIGQADELTKNE